MSVGLVTSDGTSLGDLPLHTAMLSIASLLLASRFAGHPFPRPEFIPRAEAVKIARWLAVKRSRGTPAVLFTNTSPAIRVCLAALEHGLDISDTVFVAGGEPFTPGKADVLARTGTRIINILGMAELLYVGGACADSDPDDLHLFTDKIAVIQRERGWALESP